MTTKQIISDAALVEQFTKQAEKELSKPVPVEVKTIAPDNLTVDLPGGFINREGSLVKTATVRELNGADEEAIAKAGGPGKSLSVILQKGLVLLGDESVSKNDLDSLLSGDRDAIVVGIRKATFGSIIEFNVFCNSCSATSVIKIDLDKDVPIKTLSNSDDRVWDVETKLGTVTVCLPNGLVQKKLMESSDKTVAELSTILLTGCITKINGSPTVGTDAALRLGISDRESIGEEISERSPGPRLSEVTKACEACGKAINIPLSLAALFRL